MTNLGDLKANQDIALGIGAKGVLSARPGSAAENSFYEATDVGVLYRYTGSEWVVAGYTANLSGTLAARPSPAVAGRFYEATDVGVLYRDIGSAWVALRPLPVSGLFSARPTAGVLGREFKATNTGVLYRDTGSAWEAIDWPGRLIFSASTALLDGVLPCEGQQVLISTYKLLYEALGGASNAALTTGAESGKFFVPDYRERAPMGPGSTNLLGAKTGEATHKLSIAEMPAHAHGGTATSPSIWLPDSVGGHLIGEAAPTYHSQPGFVTSDTLLQTPIASSIPSEGGGAVHNNLQPVTVCNVWIRY
jgi:microcystin-dependent protein